MSPAGNFAHQDFTSFKVAVLRDARYKKYGKGSSRVTSVIIYSTRESRLPCLGTGRGCPTGVTRRGPCPDWAISHTNVLLVFE